LTTVLLSCVGHLVHGWSGVAVVAAHWLLDATCRCPGIVGPPWPLAKGSRRWRPTLGLYRRGEMAHTCEAGLLAVGTCAHLRRRLSDLGGGGDVDRCPLLPVFLYNLVSSHVVLHVTPGGGEDDVAHWHQGDDDASSTSQGRACAADRSYGRHLFTCYFAPALTLGCGLDCSWAATSKLKSARGGSLRTSLSVGCFARVGQTDTDGLVRRSARALAGLRRRWRHAIARGSRSARALAAAAEQDALNERSAHVSRPPVPVCTADDTCASRRRRTRKIAPCTGLAPRRCSTARVAVHARLREWGTTQGTPSARRLVRECDYFCDHICDRWRRMVGRTAAHARCLGASVSPCAPSIDRRRLLQCGAVEDV
jgi:hypothetical protein